MDECRAGGLWCHEVLGHLDAFVDGTLDPETLGRVRAHVAECQACAGFGAAYGAVVAALREGGDAPPALEPARMARLREKLHREAG